MRGAILVAGALLAGCTALAEPKLEPEAEAERLHPMGAEFAAPLTREAPAADPVVEANSSDIDDPPLIWRRDVLAQPVNTWWQDPGAQGPDAVPDDNETSTPPAEPAESEEGEVDASELAKKTQNPIADLISLPLQNNFFFDVGLDKDVAYQLLVQPVVPAKLSKDWLLINRGIVPVIYQPGQSAFLASPSGNRATIVPGQGSTAGLGDIQYQGFFSPRTESSLIWGVGPVIQFPSATDERLGPRRWAAGPGLVMLMMTGPWVTGFVVSNIWSIGSSSRANVNAGVLQPFINYNFGQGWYVTSSPLISADWKADGGNAYKVPVGGGFGKIFRLGKQPINAQVQSFYDVVSPDFGPNWELRFQLQFLF